MKDLIQSAEQLIGEIQKGYIDEEEALLEVVKECREKRSMAMEMYEILEERLMESYIEFRKSLKMFVAQKTTRTELNSQQLEIVIRPKKASVSAVKM